MASSLHQWESDPLFSAAEVVQDSADRMESIFRFLLHEQSLFHDDRPDPRLLTSIEYHRRDLATILETAKWQLEDFERAVSSSAMVDKSRSREDVISRHKQFIRAIREQINHVEKSLEDPSLGDSVRNSEWVNLNEQDRDGLAIFLTGGDPIEHINRHDMEDSSILRRFLDPTTASSSKDAGIVEHESREIKNLNMNGDVHVYRHYDFMRENDSRKVGSHYSTQLGLDAPESLQETSCNRNVEDGSWDLEANEAKPKSFFQENQLRGYYNRMNIFGYLNNLWTAYGRGVTRNYTKRLKDGEEQRHSPSYIDVAQGAEGQRVGISLASGDNSFQELCSGFLAKVVHLCSRLGPCRARYSRFQYHVQVQVQVHRQSIQKILITIIMLVVLGILVSQVT